MEWEKNLLIEIADALNSGIDVKDIGFIPGTVYKTKDISGLYDYELLPSYTDMAADKTLYAKSFKVQHENTDPFNGKILVEPYPNGVICSAERATDTTFHAGNG